MVQKMQADTEKCEELWTILRKKKKRKSMTGIKIHLTFSPKYGHLL